MQHHMSVGSTNSVSKSRVAELSCWDVAHCRTFLLSSACSERTTHFSLKQTGFSCNTCDENPQNRFEYPFSCVG